MDQRITIIGKLIDGGVILEVECAASTSVMINACMAILQNIDHENCPPEIWPHVQSALNCLSLTAKNDREISKAEYDALLELNL